MGNLQTYTKSMLGTRFHQLDAQCARVLDHHLRLPGLPARPASLGKSRFTNPLFSNDPFPVIQATLQVMSPFYTLPDYDMIGFLENL
jgi:hypothetical protein